MYISIKLIIISGITLTIILIIFLIIGKKIGSAITDYKWQKKIPSLRKEIANSSRSIIKGQVSEQLAPYLPDFPFSPVDCKFLGNPIDFIVFQNLDNKDKTSVHFIEVKTGQSSLNNNERNLKQAIINKNVYYYEYRL